MQLLKSRFIVLYGLFFLNLPAMIYGQEARDTIFENNGFTHPNALYVELLGPGALYSVGYERMLLNQEQFKTSIQTGLAWYPPSTGPMRMTMPVTISEILSFDPYHVKLGIGTTMILKRFTDVDLSNSLEFLAHLRIAFRYQQTGGRYFWELSVIPFLEGDARAFELDAFQSMTSHLWAGITFGWTF